MDYKTKCETYNWKNSWRKTQEKNFCELGLGKEFLDIKTKVQSIKEKIDTLDFIKFKNVHFLKDY